jgi:hypothetical protein
MWALLFHMSSINVLFANRSGRGPVHKTKTNKTKTQLETPDTQDEDKQNKNTTGNIRYTRRRQTKQKHNTICAGHHNMQTNTNSVKRHVKSISYLSQENIKYNSYIYK